jgi:hypothetical protein
MKTEFKKSQYFRVIINGIHLYATAGQLIAGISDHFSQNCAINSALRDLSNLRKYQDEKPLGIGGQWSGYSIQLDMIEKPEPVTYDFIHNAA